MDRRDHKSRPLIGVLMLETAFPRIKGDIGNPASFEFPLAYRIVAGASPRRVVQETDPDLLEPFIKAGRELIGRGVRAITTSCGFLAIFQPQLAEALAVPVFTSSLLQVAKVQASLESGQKVGIITASKESLTRRHLAGVGLKAGISPIIGLERSGHFAAIFLDGQTDLDEARCRTEMLAAAKRLTSENQKVGAIVLECTNMPPYSADIRRATGLPVFDITSLVNQIHQDLTA